MKFDVVASENFVRELKKLSKKYSSLKAEVNKLGDILAENPMFGTPLGQDCYKIRLAIKSKGKGKSGGARIISCVIAIEDKVVLLSIYDKTVQANISYKELERLLRFIKS